MNRRQRRKIMRMFGVKDKVVEVKAVWEKYFPNGDRQLSDEEFKQAQNELNRIINAKAKKK